jgi:hypothetical protein
MLFPSAFMWIIFGAISAYLAKMRGKNPYLWFGLGMLFGLFGVLFLVFSPKTKKSNLSPQTQQAKYQGETIDIDPPYDPKLNQFLWYFLDKDNGQHGPMSFDALHKEYRGFTVTGETFVWNETLANWQPLKNFL